MKIVIVVKLRSLWNKKNASNNGYAKKHDGIIQKNVMLWHLHWYTDTFTADHSIIYQNIICIAWLKFNFRIFESPRATNQAWRRHTLGWVTADWWEPAVTHRGARERSAGDFRWRSTEALSEGEGKKGFVVKLLRKFFHGDLLWRRCPLLFIFVKKQMVNVSRHCQCMTLTMPRDIGEIKRAQNAIIINRYPLGSYLAASKNIWGAVSERLKTRNQCFQAKPVG